METDFLNFHDEEHFGSGLYQNELLDDSQGSILDIVSNNYSRQHSTEYNNSVIWDQEVEREMNGDVAVIPMSGSINTFPKLSTSPPTKDIQKILFCEWQEHLTSIEASDEDLSVELQLNDQSLVYEMLECISPENTVDISMIDSSQIKLPNTIRTESEPVTTILESNQKFKQKHKPKLKHGGKNLELLKETIKCEPFEDKIEVEEDEFEDVDNFDITKYLIGQDYVKKDDDYIVKKDDGLKLMTDDLEEDHVDIETVSEPSEMPVLEARDLTSLLEQFEASEAVNPKDAKYGKIEVKEEFGSKNFEVNEVMNGKEFKIKKEFDCNDFLNRDDVVGKDSDKDGDKNKNNFENRKTEVKIKKEFGDRKESKSFEVRKDFEIKKEVEVKKSTPNKISAELIEKMKASNQKKSISVIPAMPKKSRGRVVQEPPVSKQMKMTSNEAIQLDHDYCTVLPKNIRRSDDDNKKQIDDTALRIEKRYKSEINKQKSDILKYQPTVKNANGQLMVSLLKTNRNINNTIINTTNTNDETVKNIIVNEPSTKKRKLNLEEYLQRKGGSIMKSNDNSRANSPNSGSCSPNHDQKSADEKYRNHQELMMKMASEILKTPAKANKTGSTTKLEEFVPPEAQKKKPQPIEVQKTIKPIEEYEVVTYVSIGVNTDVTKMEEKQKIAFQINKNNVVLRNANEDDSEIVVDKTKLTEIIQPILQKASVKINSNSLITNISATLLQKSPSDSTTKIQNVVNTEVEHGEDKVVQVFEKNRKLPERVSVSVQTEEEIIEVDKPARQYRPRRSVSSSSSSSDVSDKNGRNSRRERTSSSNSHSSSMGSRWSRSRSRSRSHSVYSQSSYYSTSSRSRSRSPSLSPSRRWHTNRNSRSRHRYSRTRRRSRSNSNGYRNNYKRSRSPYSRSHSRKKRELEMEKLKEVEERRVIYVGKISDGTTKADLRRRFQSFGPITNVSVHFREHGDNYGFVTFAYKVDAYEAVEHGNDDPLVPKYDISFGGRRAFCKTRYSDLDNIEAEALNSTIYRKDEDSFDILLREVQAKLRKRKV